jgi:hypothetical protein
MKIKKRAIKWAAIILGILLLLLATPSLIQIFRLYVYQPPANPAPEEFVEIPEGGPFVMKSQPKEEVEIGYTADGRTLVRHWKDGFQLVLPAALSASASELEPNYVRIHDGENTYENDYACFAYVGLEDGFETVEEAFDERKERLNNQFGTVVLRHELEKIEDYKRHPAYIEHYEEQQWGYQPGIVIQGSGVVYYIAQDGIRYPECDLMRRVLDGFYLIDEDWQ